MKTPGRDRRHCSLRFDGPLTDEVRDALERRLLQSGVDDVQFTGNECSMRYPFPELTLDMILRMLKTPEEGTAVKPAVSPGLLLRAFMESNERGHLVHAGGWLQYVEDIYIHNFNRTRRERDDIRKQTWRKYKQGL